MYIPTLDLPLMWSRFLLLTGLSYTLGIAICFFSRRKCVRFIADFSGDASKPMGKKDRSRLYLLSARSTRIGAVVFALFRLPYQLPALTAAIICFSLTSSAFIGEIYRGSIAGVDRGQWDAAYAWD